MKALTRMITAFASLVLAMALVIWLASGPARLKRHPADSDIVRYDACRDKPPPTSAPPSSITVATYNIGYASGAKNNLPVELEEEEVRTNLAAMVEALAAIDPDIVVMQEVDFDAQRTYGIDQMEFLARGLCMPHAAYAIMWNKRYVPWPYWPPRYHFGRVAGGLAILSKFPITAHETIHFEKPRENRIWYNWFYLDRGAQRATIKTGERTFNIWNLHLEAFHPAARHEQLARLAAVVGGGADALIAAGDFNEEKGAPLAEFAAAADLARADIDVDHPWRIDHIFYRDHAFRPIAGGFLDLDASDHVPVWVRLEVLP